MTLDSNKIIGEVGASWRQSPFSMTFAIVMFIALMAAILLVYSVLTWVQELVATDNQKAEETRAEISEYVRRIDDALATFEERQKLFRDEIRERISQTDVDQERREAEFWEGINAQFDTINTQNSQHLNQLQEILETIDNATTSVAPGPPTR